MNHFDSIKKWLKIKNDNLQMFQKGSRGLFSTKDINKGDIIMQIPVKYLIELSSIEKSIKSMISMISMKSNFNNSNSTIASYILLESLNEKSKWKIYLDTFPQDLSEYIHFYKKDKMRLLQESSIMCKDSVNIKDVIEEITNEGNILYESLKDKNILPKEYSDINDFIKLFMKFRIYVDSRIFKYKKYNNDESALVPYADLLNHSNKSNTYWYFDDIKKSFIVQATEDIPKNYEIFDSYGDKSNVRLVIFYGFSIKNNPHSQLSFTYKNNLITLDKKSDLESILLNNNFYKYKKYIILFLEKKLFSHMKNIKKTEDYNIKNLLNDEIMIIKKILK